jgi:hypothetical protein
MVGTGGEPSFIECRVARIALGVLTREVLAINMRRH